MTLIAQDPIILEDFETTTQDPDRVAHVVWAESYAGHLVEAAISDGIELVALCGHRWTPTHRGVDLPACRKCLAAMSEVTS